MRQLYKQINTLVNAQNDTESAYIPLVRAFIQTCQEYDGPKEAAKGMVRSLKRKTPSSKQPKGTAAKNTA